MKQLISERLFPCLALLAASPTASAATISVTPGLNNVEITQVIYTIGGSDVVQNAPASTAGNGVSNIGDSPVVVKSVRINDGGLINLEHFNTDGATVVNVNPELGSIAGIAAFNNGVSTPSNGGLSAFADAVAVTTEDANLRNFLYYDYLLPAPPTGGTADFDLLYTRAMKVDDYILVSERNGNTYFKVTPLKADGTPYANANSLQFGGAGGGSYSVYQWNSGYAAQTNQPTQAQAFSVASVSKFFEGTTETPGPVYGFRIDNDGEADTKILIMSGNSFSDNPLNPMLVPEPSVFLMSLAGGLLLLGSRRR